MGVIFSTPNNISDNTYILKYVSKDLSYEDPFWNQFLSFEYVPNYSNDDHIILVEKLSQFKLENIINIKNLCDFIGSRCEELGEFLQKDQSDNAIFLKQLHNALFALRYSLIILHFNKDAQIFKDFYKSIYEIVVTLISICFDLKLNNINYFMHIETVTILNALFYLDIFNCQNEVLPNLVGNPIFPKYTKLLLQYIVDEKSLQSVELPKMNISNAANSYFTKSVWEYVSLGWYSNTGKSEQTKHLSTNAIYLLLKILMMRGINNCKSTLYLMSDQENHQDKEDDNSRPTSTFTLQNLYNALETNFEKEHYMLLFYVLLYKNNAFRKVVLSNQQAYSSITLPILKTMYNSIQTSSKSDTDDVDAADDDDDENGKDMNQVYVCLILLLMLTEDEKYNERIHREVVTDVTWIKDKSFAPINLGSLTVFILCRMVQSNLQVKGDKYVQTNCLACLSNMTSKFVNLHGQAAEQMLIVVTCLQKKRCSLIKLCKQNSEYKPDLDAIEETLQTMLEIINASLIFSLTNNPEMIHIFLYHRKRFIQLKELQSTKTFANNIDSILAYFTSKMEKELGTFITSERDVIKIIKKYSSSINKFNNFKSFPELKYKYVEEDSAEDFFIPYLRKLYIRESNLVTKNSNAAKMNKLTSLA